MIKFNRFIPVSMEFFCLKLSEHSKQNKVVSLKEAIATHKPTSALDGVKYKANLPCLFVCQLHLICFTV